MTSEKSYTVISSLWNMYLNWFFYFLANATEILDLNCPTTHILKKVHGVWYKYFSESKSYHFTLKIEYQILGRCNDYTHIDCIISKQDILLAIHNYCELKSLAYNAKIRSLLKFLLIRYLFVSVCGDFRPHTRIFYSFEDICMVQALSLNWA